MNQTKPKFIKYGNLTLVCIILISLIAYYFLFIFNGTNSKEFSLDINEVRKISSQTTGANPEKIKYEALDIYQSNIALSVAGGDWSQGNGALIAYKIEFPDYSIVVDTAYSQDIADGKGNVEDLKAYDRIKIAMDSAKYIIPTHEHGDHFGTILKAPNWQNYLKKSLINKSQFDNPSQLEPIKWPENSRSNFKPIEYDRYYQVAQGVVLINSPGHTKGSQMVYIKLAGGQEIILIGDVSWRHEGIERKQAHPYLSRLLLSEDRDSKMGQINTLNKLKKENPNIEFISGHDYDDLTRLKERKIVTNQF